MEITAEILRSFLGGQATTKELLKRGDVTSGTVTQLGQILSLELVKGKGSSYDQIKITFTWRATLDAGVWVENSQLELVRDLGWFPKTNSDDQIVTFSSTWEEIRLVPTNHEALMDYAPVIKKPNKQAGPEESSTSGTFNLFGKFIGAL